jgi:hypothetical protein
MANVIEADSMIEAAKASIIAYNHKDWNKAEESLHKGAVYDEKTTHRRIEGRDDIIAAWQGWAKAFPDSKATFVREPFNPPAGINNRAGIDAITALRRQRSGRSARSEPPCAPRRGRGEGDIGGAACCPLQWQRGTTIEECRD